jgi:inosine-uridine nucleoside N-ribohydrolase
MAAQKIVIDTDIGTDADDSIALALALASPELDLQAITVAGRQSFYRARIARRYLELAGRTDIKVFAGRDAPTPKPLGFTAATPIATLAGQNSKYHFNWFGNEGKGALADPPSENAETALQRIFATDDNIGLVAIGPFTNIYQALSQSASSSPPGPMAQNIAQMAVMGIHIDPTPFGSAFISLRRLQPRQRPGGGAVLSELERAPGKDDMGHCGRDLADLDDQFRPQAP